MKAGLVCLVGLVGCNFAIAQGDNDAATAVALAALKGQRAQCLQVKDAAQRARCIDGVLELALKLTESAQQPKKALAPVPAPPPKDAWATVVSDGLAYLTREFKDPGSVRYREVALHGSGERPLAMCGELNGRNSYGAYVGYRRFFVLLPALASEIEDSKLNVVAPMWSKVCNSKLADVEIAGGGDVLVSRLAKAPTLSAEKPAEKAVEPVADGCPPAAPGCSWGRKTAQ